MADCGERRAARRGSHSRPARPARATSSRVRLAHPPPRTLAHSLTRSHPPDSHARALAPRAQAGMYDFSQSEVVAWYIDNIIKPAMDVNDGVWLDGDGPDNGCYQCSGSIGWGSLPPPYPANNASEVDAFCAGEMDMWAAAHTWLFANGGQDAQACIRYINGDAAIPARGDAPDVCAAKLLALELTPADLAVGFASDRNGGHGVHPDRVAQVVASFLLVRGPHWYYGVDRTNNTVPNATAALLLTDYGAPLGNMTNASAVFSREYEGASVSLDCDTYTATFTPK